MANRSAPICFSIIPVLLVEKLWSSAEIFRISYQITEYTRQEFRPMYMINKLPNVFNEKKKRKKKKDWQLSALLSTSSKFVGI